MSEDCSKQTIAAGTDSAGQTPHYRFTVFTPTYNRAHTLPRVMESLTAQTYRDFEWSIVDDGSTDGTADLVRTWQAACAFPIRYVWQENQGAHAAFNRAVAEARGEFFLFAGSDDSFPPDALGLFKRHWEAIPDQDRPGFVGVTGLCIDQNGRLVGAKFPKEVLDSDAIEIRYRYGLRGEKWGFSRTDVLRQFPFPTSPEARYVPETVVWSPIAQRYKTRYINEIVRTYYLPDGVGDHLSDFRDCAKIAFGARLMNATVLNNELLWFRYQPASFLKAAANYARFSFHQGIGLRQQLAELSGASARCIWVAALPVGLLIYLRDRLKTRGLGRPAV